MGHSVIQSRLTKRGIQSQLLSVQQYTYWTLIGSFNIVSHFQSHVQKDLLSPTLVSERRPGKTIEKLQKLKQYKTWPDEKQEIYEEAEENIIRSSSNPSVSYVVTNPFLAWI
jgi:hypothetical protein